MICASLHIGYGHNNARNPLPKQGVFVSCAYLLTVNLIFAFFLPRFAVQVMVTLPFFLKVTVP